MESQVQQVANLLTKYNSLDQENILKRVSNEFDSYILELQNEVVIGCIKVVKVQWYQWEILHLSVDENHRNRGIGTLLLQRAIKVAKIGNARICQCTIKVGNKASENVFFMSGFREVSRFFNLRTKSTIAVWAKVL